ncbi:MAG: WecB/TagA/CpsF family glycosyltransferase, partial [Polyangiaceae bacterium]
MNPAPDPPERVQRLHIGGVPIDPLTMSEAVDAIEGLVRAGRGGAVFTPNVDHVVECQGNPAFRRAYEAVDLSLADGMPVVWSSRLLGRPVPEKVSGSDLVEPLVRRAGARGWSVLLL